MNFTANLNIIRWTIITFAVMITALILWNTYQFFQQLKESERKNMNEYAVMARDLDPLNNEDNLSELHIEVGTNTTTVPLISVNFKGEMRSRNLPEDIEKDTTQWMALIKKYEKENDPIVTTLDGKPFTTIYYGNSTIIEKIKYYPLALALIMLLFGAVIWFFYRSHKASEQNKLWAGMAKESAHQIGTPLSSLVGWTTILKEEAIDQSYVTEMEKDINRLRIITDRFSKIGSIPELEKVDVVDKTQVALDYLAARVSKLVEVKVDLPSQPIMAMINESLYAWVIENLVKNGIDAMKGKGTITIFMKATAHQIVIKISDTGKGIPKSQWERIFEPGYTTKKRGWGLGLSLARRIVTDYHKGKIKVCDSKKNAGTTFEILLPRV